MEFRTHYVREKTEEFRCKLDQKVPSGYEESVFKYLDDHPLLLKKPRNPSFSADIEFILKKSDLPFNKILSDNGRPILSVRSRNGESCSGFEGSIMLIENYINSLVKLTEFLWSNTNLYKQT